VFDAFLIDHPFVALTVWAALYISDYCLTLWGARLYKETASAFIDFGGSYEIEEVFKKDIDALRRVSPQFVYRLCLSSAALLAFWWYTVRIADLPAFFLVLFGGYVLVELVVHARHISNILMFRTMGMTGAVAGKIKYARWVTERLSSAQLLSFAALFALCFLMSDKVFFLGGTLGCLASARRHIRQARRKPGPATPIRAAIPADAAAVARVHVESWKVAYRGIMPDDVIARTDLPYRTRFWTERIATDEWPVLAIEEGSELVAFCQMIPTPDSGDDPKTVGHIPSIHVLPHLRGKGHGRALLAHAFAEFRRRGFSEVTLWVLAENASARAFYEKLGFRNDGGIKTYPGTEVPEVRYRIGLASHAHVL
jgi:ribosomal protein S18 acetylase RimI-like enzyme